MFFSLKHLLLHSENISYLPKYMCIYMIAGKTAWKPNQHRGFSRHWGKLPALTVVHQEQTEVPGWAEVYGPHLTINHSVLCPLCSLSFFSSVQCFHNILIYLVACGNLAQHGVCCHGFWHSSPLSFRVLSQQRVMHSVKQPIWISLHLVLYRGIWIAPESYLIFKLSVYILLPRWTRVLDADWSVREGGKLKEVLIWHECVYKSCAKLWLSCNSLPHTVASSVPMTEMISATPALPLIQSGGAI